MEYLSVDYCEGTKGCSKWAVEGDFAALLFTRILYVKYCDIERTSLQVREAETTYTSKHSMDN